MTKKQGKIYIIIAAVIIAALMMLASFNAGWRYRGEQIQPLAPDTVTIHHWDTTFLPSPPDNINSVEEKPYPVPYYIKDTDTIHDSILVVLPYEHHQADLEDVATVWYSGYDTKIDSALVYKHHTTQIIHQPYEVFKTPRLTVDLGVGNHQWKQLDPYVFASATVNVSNWKIEPYAGYSYSRQAMFGISVSKSFVLIK